MGVLRERIHPTSDLTTNYSEISKSLQLRNEVAIFIVNGQHDTVSLGYETYNLMKAKIELLEMLALAEEDERQGRMIPVEVVHKSIEAMLLSED